MTGRDAVSQHLFLLYFAFLKLACFQMKWISANEHSKTSKRVCIAQGTDPDYMWAVIVMLYWLKLVGGICTGILSILWLVHVVRVIVPLLLVVHARYMQSQVERLA